MTPLKILILEDSETDAEIVQRLLKKQIDHTDFKLVMTREAFLAALEQFHPDVILADNSLPQFNASEALKIVKEHSLHIPFILVTGTVSEEFAAGIIKAGADDYLLKDRLTRLPAAIEAALKQKQSEREKIEASNRLAESEQKYRILIEQAFDGIIIYTFAGEILDCNKSACLHSGYTKEELTALSVAELFFEEDLAVKPLYFQRQKAAPGGLDYRRLKRKDGSYVEMEIGTRRMPDGNLMAIGRDITERKKAAEQLEQSEIRFRTMVENNEGLIGLLDKDFKTIYRSPSAERITGYSLDEFKKNDITKFCHPEEVDYIKNISLTALANPGKPVAVVFRFRHKEGHYLWLEGVITNMLPDPNIGGIVSNLRNITKRKKAEEKLRTAYNLLSFHIENAPLGYIEWDSTLKVKDWSRQAEEIFGWTKNEFISLQHDGYSQVFKEDLALATKIAEELLSGRVDRNTVQHRNHTRDGRIIWCEWFNSVLKDKDGKVTTVLSLVQDITERKMAEEELKKSFTEKQTLAERMSTILNTLPANIALLDDKGTIIDVNDSWKDFADDNGFRGHNYAIGDNYVQTATRSFSREKEDGKIVASGIKKVLACKIKEFVFEYSCDSPNEKRWFRMVATPVRGKEHNGAVVMHIDISKLHRLEQERLQSKIEEQKKVTEAMILGQEKERNALGRELHDNMNQILAGINLLLGILRSKPERLEEYLPLCIENIHLAIAENRKIAHGLVSPNQVSETLIQQIEKICGNMLQNAGLRTKVIHHDFDEALLKDEQKLAVYRVVQEQCSNIIRYAKAQQAEFLLSTTEKILLLSIKDDGQGMQPGDSTDGIGLQNMLSRISVLNGTLKIETAPGKGFELNVKMPLE